MSSVYSGSMQLARQTPILGITLVGVGLALLLSHVGSMEVAGGGTATPDPKTVPFTTRLPRSAPPRAALLGTPLVPCSDPRGCPDLTVYAPHLEDHDHDPVVRNYAPSSCAVQEGMAQPGDNLLLRFTFTSPNLGPGDLVVGAVAQHPDWFDFAPCHGHYHFREYADYRLWTTAGYQAWTALRQTNPDVLSATLLNSHPDVAAQLVAGNKFGFCVIDFLIVPGGPPAGPAFYRNCEFNQGISVGWADVYVKATEGQWFDVTDVPDGTYVIEAEINAERFFQEANYANNSSASAPFSLAVPSNQRPPTRTPTTTQTPGPTNTATASPTPTICVPIPGFFTCPGPTSAATPTPAPGSVGGRSLALRASIPGPGAQLAWMDGAVEIGYAVVRWSPRSTVLLSPGSVSSASTTALTDPFPAAGSVDAVYCYATLPLGPAGPLGVSDVLCLFPSTATDANPPHFFTIQLGEASAARLSWVAPGGQSGYRLAVLPLDGRPPQTLNLTADRTTELVELNGAATCFALQALVGATVIGATDILCGVPGASTLSTGGTPLALPRALRP